MCVGFVDTVIEGNYFGKRILDNNVYIISFYEVDKILKAEQINLTNFAITVIYRYITRYIITGKMLVHDETKGCIFDMCGDKNDVIYFSQKPILCDECLSKLKQYKVSDEYIKVLKKELSKIRKSKYYVISDFIKYHPYISLSIGVLGSLLINIISNLIYDFF